MKRWLWGSLFVGVKIYCFFCCVFFIYLFRLCWNDWFTRLFLLWFANLLFLGRVFNFSIGLLDSSLFWFLFLNLYFLWFFVRFWCIFFGFESLSWDTGIIGFDSWYVFWEWVLIVSVGVVVWIFCDVVWPSGESIFSEF
mgnify:FL=1